MAKFEAHLQFGLMSSHNNNKYLTHEVFNFGISAGSRSMKKKCIFTMVPASNDSVYIRSHLNKYLAVDHDGTVTCNTEDPTEEAEFIIEAQPDGRWLVKSNKYGNYLGTGNLGEKYTLESTKKDTLSADTNTADPWKFWTFHWAMHPQVTMRNLKRKKYCHLDTTDGPEQNMRITTDEIVPWGHDATITVLFQTVEDAAGVKHGRYALQAPTGMYLSAGGMLVPEISDQSLFIVEFNKSADNEVTTSFKSASNGKYLTGLGAAGLLKATKSTVTDDEKFVLEESWPQATFKSGLNGNLVSSKSGVELKSDWSRAKEPSDNEIFELRPNEANQWTIQSASLKHWAVDDSGAVMIESLAGAPTDANLFTIEWGEKDVSIKSVKNGKYVKTIMNKVLKANGDDAGSAENPGCSFVMELINRPQLVLRGTYGFVHTLPSGLLECTSTTPEVYSVEPQDGKYAIYTPTAQGEKKYWKVGQNGITASESEPEFYSLSLAPNSKLNLSFEGKYFAGAQNGAFTASGGDSASSSTNWEY
jgi:fascin 1/2